jgi:hypothetical protein
LKVNRDEARDAAKRAEKTSSEGALRVTFPSNIGAQSGKATHVTLAIHVAEGWHLQGPDGLRIDASGGSESEITFEEIFIPAPALLPDPASPGESGWAGSFEANLSFSSSESVSKGKHDVTVRVRYRACGEGTCRPEAVLEFSIPVDVV